MRVFTYLISIILSIVFLSACSKTVDDKILRDAHLAVKNGAIIVDVRTSKEFKGSHIKGAINIPLDKLAKSYTQLSIHKTIIVYCRTGNRSAKAAKFLLYKGFKTYDVATQSEWEREVPKI